MSDKTGYEVVQDGGGWVLCRFDHTPLVHFPTENQAVRAGLAVCRDEGVASLVIRRAGGGVEEVGPLLSLLQPFEV